jgi:prevent-host-death family protein
MQIVNIHAAKTQLSALIEQVEAGEEITIARAGKPVAKLVPIARKDLTPRKLGMLAGQYQMPKNFDDLYADEIQALFEGE